MSTSTNFNNSTNKPLYGERIIEESKIICFENPNKKRCFNDRNKPSYLSLPGQYFLGVKVRGKIAKLAL